MPIGPMSPTRSPRSGRRVPAPRPAVVPPCPLRWYMPTRWASIRSGNVRRQALWSSPRPWIKMSVSPRPASNQATSMSLQRARMFTQHPAVHFARAGQRKLVQTMDPLRPLVSSQPALLEKSIELLLRQVADDERDRYFSELGVWAPDHAHIDHSWMRAQHRLDLVRVDVGSAPDDDVLDPADDVQESRLVDETQLPPLRPAVGRPRTEVLAPVPILHDVAAPPHFPNSPPHRSHPPLHDLPLSSPARP